MLATLQDAGNALLDFLYPAKCYLCGTVGSYMCEACVAAWPRPEEPLCPRCGHPLADGCTWCGRRLAPLTAAGFACAYDEGAREAVHLLKYSGRRRVALPMAEEMARAVWSARLSPELRAAEVLVPIELHRARLRKRGYNQAEWLAEELSIQLNRPVGLWLTRTRDTPSQVGLSREQRDANVRGAFSASPEAKGRRILLVDDVSTTGATARDAARALKEAGVVSVCLLTFARDL